MAALREWSAALNQLSTPGLRPRLVAAAWLAGETRVSALAEAARTSRPTIYADLRSQGIDPDDRSKEDPMTMTPLAIDGITGLNDETDARAIHEAERRYLAEHPDGDGIGLAVSELLELQLVLRFYNNLRPLLAAELAARRDRDRALHLVEVRWEALTTATAWHAAHHAYVVAVDAAYTAITTWATAAREASTSWFPVRRAEEFYEQRILAAGHPPVERLAVDADAESRCLAEELTTLHDRRIVLAAQTLNAAPTSSH
ncbi:hypothetical protein SVTN_40555 (plasmid) [Streptomyces vietnamensis]|uniref:Uncharacterized protein n=1 Tax=Streptomyces vietnamensis TaxID=362257 RepID=A0A0B5ILN9_9ACTN|nr:hypothetical protein SVTN_40555 [Streptomyces vietnamensis]